MHFLRAVKVHLQRCPAGIEHQLLFELRRVLTAGGGDLRCRTKIALALVGEVEGRCEGYDLTVFIGRDVVERLSGEPRRCELVEQLSIEVDARGLVHFVDERLPPAVQPEHEVDLVGREHPGVEAVLDQRFPGRAGRLPTEASQSVPDLRRLSGTITAEKLDALVADLEPLAGDPVRDLADFSDVLVARALLLFILFEEPSRGPPPLGHRISEVIGLRVLKYRVAQTGLHDAPPSEPGSRRRLSKYSQAQRTTASFDG